MSFNLTTGNISATGELSFAEQQALLSTEKNPTIEQFNRDRARFYTIKIGDSFTNSKTIENASNGNPKAQKDENKPSLPKWLTAFLGSDEDDKTCMSPYEAQYNALYKELMMTEEELSY